MKRNKRKYTSILIVSAFTLIFANLIVTKCQISLWAGTVIAITTAVCALAIYLSIDK